MAHTQGAGASPGKDPHEPVTAELPVVSADDQPRRTPGRGALVGAFGILAAIIVVAIVAAFSLQRGWLGMSSTNEDDPAPAPATRSSTQAETSSETRSSNPASTTAASSTSTASSEGSSTPPVGRSSTSASSTRAAAAPTTDASEPTSQAPAPGQYSSAAPGSNQTSAAFADSVYYAFNSAYAQSGNPNTPVEAYSPVTRQWYKMQCTGDANAVTCRGGNGAVVYIS